MDTILYCIPLLTTPPALIESGTLPDVDDAAHVGNTIDSLQFKISLCPRLYDHVEHQWEND